MPSKKTSQSKRAKVPLRSDFLKSFAKDWARLSESGRYDMNLAKEGMLLVIANSGPLPPEWLDHALEGKYQGHREFHAGGDFLVIYRLVESDTVVFVRAGTHAELFD